MLETLLQTKLYIPPLRPNIISRPRLIERLGLQLGHKLTLVSAPAGFGKTTLVMEWIHNSQFAWFSLDEGDNDLTRFLTYFVAALQNTQPDLGETAVSLLHSPQPPPTEAVMTALLNEIAETGAGYHVLVLDDYHLITNTAVHQVITYLLEKMPPSLQLVIITRADPQLLLPRWRARGQMCEIRQVVLRFTAEEAATFLNEVRGLSLTAGHVEMLEARTEGWIAGLQMAAIAMQSPLSIRGRDDTAEFIAAFSGNHRFILDYLTEEVIQALPDTLQQFLLQTSILGRLPSMALLVVAHPEMSKDDYDQIQTFRQQHDELYYHVVEPRHIRPSVGPRHRQLRRRHYRNCSSRAVPANVIMLNLKDRSSIEENKPLLIAHRDGVISREAPENSLAAVLHNPELLGPSRQSYEIRQTIIEQDGIDPVMANIIRLAVDGLWFSELLALAPPQEPLRTQLMEKLLSLTKAKGE